jgi:hypothetical protein
MVFWLDNLIVEMRTTVSKKRLLFVDPAYQALALWLVFILANLLINGTIPFAMGMDMRAWSQSTVKFLLVGFIVYGLLFTAAPLILTKGWETIRQRAFLLPLCLAVLATTFSLVLWRVNAIAILVLAYLHWRFDLSELGLRSCGRRGDILAILIIGGLGLVQVLVRSGPLEFSALEGLVAAFDRLFANPGSSVENLFYFGFLTERLSRKTGRWLTPLIIGLMYVAHEMSNPEYWYEGMNFTMTYFGVAILAAIYLWRRSAIIIWIGDGLMRFVGKLL